jgi:hypothetical protein
MSEPEYRTDTLTHYTVRACADISLETRGTSKGCEREFNKKVKILKAVAKALGLAVWVDEVLVEE